MPETTFNGIRLTARKELEHIIIRLEKYAQDTKYNFVDCVSFLMAKTGYKKYYYIPVDNDELFEISQKSIAYMKKYALKPEQFINVLLNLHEQCKNFGYTIDTAQTTIKEEYGSLRGEQAGDRR